MGKQEIIEKLSDVISKLNLEFGSDSYFLRCELFDIKEAIKELE